MVSNERHGKKSMNKMGFTVHYSYCSFTVLIDVVVVDFFFVPAKDLQHLEQDASTKTGYFSYSFVLANAKLEKKTYT